MSSTVFSHSVRVLACGNCGAPLNVPPAGGAVTCGYCRTASQVGGRNEGADVEAARQTPAMDEATRFEKLRAQAAHPALLPQSVAHLSIGGVLLPQHAEGAMAEWKQARSELAATGQFPAAERLFHLTRMLSDHLATSRDEMRRRALLETAMELLQAPRHRQVLRGTLTCNAARVGDLAAADAWLAGCHPLSDDIHVDTAWRFSKAYVCTARRDFNGVLQVLGSRLGDIPLASAEIEGCALLRANALERLGQTQQAAEQLYAVMGPGTRGAAVLEQLRTLHSELALCPASFAAAKHRVDEEIMTQGRERTLRVTSIVGPIIGTVIFGSVSLFMIAAGLFDKKGPVWPPVAIGSFFLLFVALFVFLGIFGNLRQRRRETHIYASGLDASLTVLDLQRGGKNQPDILKVIVLIAGRPPYEKTCQLSSAYEALTRVPPGGPLRAKVDPQNPDVVLPFV
jgi:hypothetical protein